MTTPLVISKAPLGVLGAFALKNNGRNPAEFADVLAPSADVYDNYVSDTLSRQGVTTNVSIGAGNSVVGELTVPQSKIWRVLAIGVQHQVNAADGAIRTYVSAGIVPPGGAVSSPIWGGQSAETVGSTTARQAGLYLGEKLFLPPGWKIQFVAYANPVPTVLIAFSNSALVHEIDL